MNWSLLKDARELAPISSNQWIKGKQAFALPVQFKLDHWVTKSLMGGVGLCRSIPANKWTQNDGIKTSPLCTLVNWTRSMNSWEHSQKRETARHSVPPASSQHHWLRRPGTTGRSNTADQASRSNSQFIVHTGERETRSGNPRGCSQQNPDYGKLEDKPPGLPDNSSGVVRWKKGERDMAERTTGWKRHKRHYQTNHKMWILSGSQFK